MVKYSWYELRAALEMKFMCSYDETADTENTTSVMFAWVYEVDKTVLFIHTETHRIYFIYNSIFAL